MLVWWWEKIGLFNSLHTLKKTKTALLLCTRGDVAVTMSTASNNSKGK
jgi:hypothetical protein